MRAKYLILLCWLLTSLAPVSAAHGVLRNQLQGNPSPYLAMHAPDPTAWQNWSREAVDLARKQNKLIFVSVGYYSCHWCHVMQRESYRDAEIAAFINKHFIPIKVDRETEPALDAHLIGFADRTLGYSGWPLNVFLTPQGHPLYATVYLPPKDFLQLIQKLQTLWQQDATGLGKLAAAEQPGGNGPGEPVPRHELAADLAMKAETIALQMGSPMQGGFGDASKFPYAPHLRFLLNRVNRDDGGDLKGFLQLTLDNMERYGLRDHLQGGFFRYTVDPGWKTPHFEKMLYDNAQLALVYLLASERFGNERYSRIARETLDFMQAEMMDRRGALIGSLSAIDNKGVEGGYYLWSKSQVRDLLSSEEWKVYEVYAGMVDPSPLDDGYLPVRAVSTADIGRRFGLSPARVTALIESSQRKLVEERNKRILPKDDKLIAGWNGLALSAFSVAAGEFRQKEYRQTAMRIRNYIVSTLWNGHRLLRASDNGKALGQASLEDYAGVALGLVDWAELTGSEADFRLAREVTLQAWQRFYTNQGWRLSEPGFIPMESPADVMMDGHLPSPSATILEVSKRLAARLQDTRLQQRALAALNSGTGMLQKEPFWYASHIRAMAAN